MEDCEIIRLYWQRNEAAIEQTETKYGGNLFQMALRILNNREDAAEGVNDTLWETWNAIPPARPQYFFAYIAKLCRYICFGKLDWQSAWKRKAPVVELTEELQACIPDPAANVELQMEMHELERLLNAFLAGLQQEKRLIFLRRYWYADSVRDIASRYKISESKVKTTLFRVRRELKDYLQQAEVTL